MTVEQDLSKPHATQLRPQDVRPSMQIAPNEKTNRVPPTPPYEESFGLSILQ